MKNLITSLALLLASTVAIAQHSVTLTWTASVDTGGTVNVYRATSACAGGGTPSFVKLQSGVVAAGPYVDSTVGAGLFCYYVTALVNGVRIAPLEHTWRYHCAGSPHCPRWQANSFGHYASYAWCHAQN